MPRSGHFNDGALLGTEFVGPPIDPTLRYALYPVGRHPYGGTEVYIYI